MTTSFPSEPASGAEPESGPLRLTTSQHDGAMTLHVAGEIDLSTVPELESHLAKELAKNLRLLVVDLSGVSFIGSVGLAALVQALEVARANDVTLRLVCGTQPATRALVITGLINHFEIYEDVPSALNGRHPPSGS